MGASTSSLRSEEVEAMQKATNFSADEIKKLYDRFQYLDKDSSGTISLDEFLSVPELSLNPLVSRLTAVMDADSEDGVNFKRFLEVLSYFSEHCDSRERMKFIFRIYDVDGDGFVSQADLLAVIKLCVGTNLTEEQLKNVAERTIAADDKNKDGKLDFAEFCNAISQQKDDRKLIIKFDD